MTQLELADRVGTYLGIRRRLASRIISEVLAQMRGALLEGHDVRLAGLGAFRWIPIGEAKSVTHGRPVTIPAGRKLRFIPAVQLRRRRVMSEEEGMNKYGVVLDDQKTKTADVGRDDEERICPRCGKRLDDAGACPEHGTEPFEPDTAP